MKHFKYSNRSTFSLLVIAGIFASVGIPLTTAASLRTVALTGTPVPDAPAGVNFFSFRRSPLLNNAGQAAFMGFLTGTEVDGTNNKGIWQKIRRAF